MAIRQSLHLKELSTQHAFTATRSLTYIFPDLLLRINLLINSPAKFDLFIFHGNVNCVSIRTSGNSSLIENSIQIQNSLKFNENSKNNCFVWACILRLMSLTELNKNIKNLRIQNMNRSSLTFIARLWSRPEIWKKNANLRIKCIRDADNLHTFCCEILAFCQFLILQLFVAKYWPSANSWCCNFLLRNIGLLPILDAATFCCKVLAFCQFSTLQYFVAKYWPSANSRLCNFLLQNIGLLCQHR